MPQVLLSVREKAGSARPVSRLDAKIILPIISLRYNSPEAAGRCPLPLSAVNVWPIRGRSEGRRQPPIPGRFGIFRATAATDRRHVQHSKPRITGGGGVCASKGKAAAADRKRKELYT